ncbi:MAG: LamB/YcsF family protein [Micrococcales bacterium]|nr:LamB/YcsF family protein [Micrococcales bacterium]
MTPVIDLNADLGESFGAWVLGDDDAMLEVVTSANVACGFHAGDATTLRRTVARAAERGVVVGAQVGYHDLAGFGRRRIDVAPEDLTADVLYQLGALEAMCRVTGTRVRYVKPHGALYTTVAVDEAQAAAVVAAVAAYDRSLPLLGLPGSALLAAAAAEGLPTVAEAFADRGYDADGRLVSRREPGALVTDPAEVADRVVRMVRERRVTAVDGTDVTIAADSVCVHGDTPGAVAVATAVRDALAHAGVGLRPFAGP